MKTITALLLALCSALSAAAAERPNIMVVMVDDMGFSDLGCYGGEIQTPNLDQLAADGLRFTQFYNTAKCHSSRVCLLTGMYSNQAGQESMREGETVAERLKVADYFTAMTGKWHLDKQPTDHGFDRYWGHLSGATNFFTGDNTFRLNGEKWDVPRDEDFYTTTANADWAIQFIDQAKAAEKPMFLYMAFNAPHYPLHCLEQDYRVYEDTYKVGWDVIRKQRQEKQKQLNLFGDTHGEEGVTPAPRPDHVKPWDALTEEEKDWEAQRMAAYAAMLHRVDIDLGRVIDHLKAKGMFENTLILFVSDNGACPFDRTRGKEHRPWDPESYWCYSPGWAHVCNTPFRLYKQNQHEGGITSPAIAHWPAGLKAEPGSITHQPAHLIDIMPTIKQLGRVPVPAGPAPPLSHTLFGRSLVPLFEGKAWVLPRELYFRFGNNRAVRVGDMKLVSFRHSPWELYDLSQDRTELNDLSDDRPELVESLRSKWMDWAEQVNRLPPGQRRPVKDTMQKANF